MTEGFNLTEIRGDLFSAPNSSSLAHCISKDCRLGAGIAKAFKQKYGRVDELMRMGTGVGGVSPLKISPFGGRFVYNLVTKEKYFQKPTYDSLRLALVAMKDHAIQHGVEEIAMPKIGCGMDKLEWPNVQEMIRDVFDSSDIRITVYFI